MLWEKVEMRIAVAGGTGLIGRMVVNAVRRSGGTAVVLACSVGVDLVASVGIDTALEGADAVIDVTNVVTMGRRKSVRFFASAGRNLLAAERRAGIGHHVTLSLVGVDRVDVGYYAGKRRQEQLALSGDVPTTVLRSTHFYEFASQALQRSGPVVLLPRMLGQPIAAREVADMLVGVAHGEPRGLLPDLAGPALLHVPDMVRRLARARGSRRPVLAVRLPGAAGSAMASGGLLPAGGGPRGRQTFEEWLPLHVVYHLGQQAD